MADIKKIVRRILEDSFSLEDRPYGIAYTGAMIENHHDWEKLWHATEQELRRVEVQTDGWLVPKDPHMTICLGELPLHRKMAGDLNSEVILRVTHFGINELAAAFKVTGYMSKNETQHITVLFKNQPSDSKEIKNWTPLQQPFDVIAVIREVPALR